MPEWVPCESYRRTDATKLRAVSLCSRDVVPRLLSQGRRAKYHAGTTQQHTRQAPKGLPCWGLEPLRRWRSPLRHRGTTPAALRAAPRGIYFAKSCREQQARLSQIKQQVLQSIPKVLPRTQFCAQIVAQESKIATNLYPMGAQMNKKTSQWGAFL